MIRWRTFFVVLLLLVAGCTGPLGNGNRATANPTPTLQQTGTVAPSTATATGTETATSTEPRTQQGSEWIVTVTRVVDGDTLEVTFVDGHSEDIRLLGVDTPEVHTSNDPAEFEGIAETLAGNAWLRDWGHKASKYARTRLTGEQVTIRTDPEGDRRGSYGRLLVYVIHDGQDLTQALIEQGYARVYDSQFSKRSQYASAERAARAGNVGLWNFEPTATVVPDGGSETSLAVVDVHADADGNDHENLNDEYLVFENTGGSSLDLSGWTVSDEADHTYTFPTGFSLDPGEQVTLYTGSGTDTDAELYWDSDSAVWNNGGDTIIVTNTAGEQVLEGQYS